ncbi:MAG: Zn-dependent alcohol dehydrogenase [Dehalococcoidia bacterium]|jgi:Zn-dependent alcohol dehydrogenase
MKAAVCYEFSRPLVIEDIDIADPREGEVKVKVAATAVCHSDIHDMKGELPGATPFVGGHETAGYVDKVGPGVNSVKAGDPVVVSLLLSCGKCYYCSTGLPHLCTERFAPPQVPRLHNKKGDVLDQKGSVGGFAEYVVVDESQVVKVPADMPLDRAALLACGVITGFGAVVNRTKVKAFQSVVVMGAGGVGINAIQGAAYVGAYPIIAVDVLDDKMRKAMEFGATHMINAKREDAADEVRNLTGGRGADYVYVTVGSIEAIKQGFSMSGVRGTTVLIGLPNFKDPFCFLPLELIPNEKNIIGGFMGATNLDVDIPNLITMYQTGHLKLDELITGRYPLDKINEAVELTEKGEGLRNVIMFE